MTTIKSGGGLRTLIHDGKEIKKIIFYGQGRIYHHVGRGWLEACVQDNAGNFYDFTHDVRAIRLPDVKRATKQNLNRTDHYVFGSGADRTLYIYLPEPPKDLGERLRRDGELTRVYCSYISIPLDVDIETGYIDESDDKFKYHDVPATEVMMLSGYRSEKTPFGIQVDETVAEFESKGIKGTDSLLVADLLKFYTITPKNS